MSILNIAKKIHSPIAAYDRIQTHINQIKNEYETLFQMFQSRLTTHFKQNGINQTAFHSFRASINLKLDHWNLELIDADKTAKTNEQQRSFNSR